MPKLKKGKAYVPCPAEIKRLFKLISTMKYAKRDRLLMLMSYGLGLRVMELAGLRIYQVINEDGTVIQDISLVKTKYMRNRMIYLPDIKEDGRIHQAIKEYIEERQSEEKTRGILFSFKQPLFKSQKGTSFTARTLQRRFTDLYKMAGIHGASSHSGRRTFATTLIEQGADIKALSTLMGHSSVSMTAQYVEDNPKRLKKIASLSLSYL